MKLFLSIMKLFFPIMKLFLSDSPEIRGGESGDSHAKHNANIGIPSHNISNTIESAS